jgi:hypothetical protein
LYNAPANSAQHQAQHADDLQHYRQADQGRAIRAAAHSKLRFRPAFDRLASTRSAPKPIQHQAETPQYTLTSSTGPGCRRATPARPTTQQHQKCWDRP